MFTKIFEFLAELPNDSTKVASLCVSACIMIGILYAVRNTTGRK